MNNLANELVDNAQPVAGLLQSVVADMGEETSIQVQPKAKPTKKDEDDAFDALANFLFERYRKHKEEVEDKIDD